MSRDHPSFWHPALELFTPARDTNERVRIFSPILAMLLTAKGKISRFVVPGAIAWAENTFFRVGSFYIRNSIKFHSTRREMRFITRRWFTNVSNLLESAKEPSYGFSLINFRVMRLRTRLHDLHKSCTRPTFDSRLRVILGESHDALCSNQSSPRARHLPLHKSVEERNQEIARVRLIKPLDGEF